MDHDSRWTNRRLDPRDNADGRRDYTLGEWLDRMSEMEPGSSRYAGSRRARRARPERFDTEDYDRPDDIVAHAMQAFDERSRRIEERTERAIRMMADRDSRAADLLDAVDRLIERQSDLRETHARSVPGQAVEAIGNAVRQLGARLDRMDKNLAHLGDTDKRDDLRDLAARLEKRLETLGRQAGPASGRDGMASRALEQRLAEIAARIDGLTQSAADPANRDGQIHKLETKLNSILDALQTSAQAAEKGRISGAVADIRSHQQALDDGGIARPARRLRAEDVAQKLKGDLDRISQRLDDIASQAKLAQATPSSRDTGELSRNLEKLAQTVEAAMAERNAIGQNLAQTLAERDGKTIDGLVDKLKSELDRHTLTIQAKLEQTKPANLRDDLDTLRWEIGALSHKLDAKLEMAGAGSDQALRDEIAQLRQSLTDLSSKNGIEDLQRRIEEIGEKINGLDSSRMAASLAQEQPEAVATLGQQLGLLIRKVDVLGGLGTDPATIDRLSDQIAELRSLIGTGEREAAPASETRQLETMIADLMRRMEQTQDHKADPGAISALERQVSKLAERLDRSGTEVAQIASLERGIQDLFRHLDSVADTARANAEDVARTAAQQALHEAIDRLPTRILPDDGRIEELARDVSDMRKTRETVERRTQETLEAVHSALERIVNRLASLESGTQPNRIGASTASQHVPEAEPSTAPPMSEQAEERPERKPSRASRLPDLPSEDKNGAAIRAQLKTREIVQPTSQTKLPFWKAALDSLGKKDKPAAHEDKPASVIPKFAISDRNETDDALDMPIEPGSNGEKHAAKLAVDPTIGSDDSKQAYIAAARRAMQIAETEKSKLTRDAQAKSSQRNGLKTQSKGGLKEMVAARKKPIILSMAALLVVYAAVEVAKTSFGSSDSGQNQVPQKQSSLLEAPASSRIARQLADPETTGSVAPRRSAPAATTEQQAPLFTPPEATTMAALDTKPATERGFARESAPVITRALPDIPAAVTSPGLRAALGKGDPAAAFELGQRLADGRTILRDVKLAIQWLEVAADAGLAPAQFRLGNIHEKGSGVARDTKIAQKWYERAAAAGNSKAIHNLGVLIAEGVDGSPDFAKAVEHFRRAAELGVRDSQYNMAILLARGLGTAQNLTEAYKWLGVVAKLGDEEAARKRDEIGRRLSADDLAKARAAVDAFRPNPADPRANEVEMPQGGWDQPLAEQKGKAKPATPPKTTRG